MNTQIPEQTISAIDSYGAKVYRQVVSVVNLDGSAISSGGGGSGGSALSDNMVVDANGIYWLVRDSGSALTFVKLDGVTGTPASPVRPLTDRDSITFTWKAKNAFTDTSAGSIVANDVLTQVVWLDATGANAANQFATWFCRGLQLSATPISSNVDFSPSTSTGATKTADQSLYQVKTAFGTQVVDAFLIKVAVFDTASTSTVSVSWFTASGIALSSADSALVVEGSNVIAQSERVDARAVDSSGALVTSANPFPVAQVNNEISGLATILVGSFDTDIDVAGFNTFSFDATYLLTSGNNTYGSFIGSATVSVIVDSLPIQVGFFDSNGFFKRTLDGVVRTGFVGVAGFKTLRITSSITAGSISLKWRKTAGMSLKVSPADKFVAYKFLQSEEISGTTYILKSDGDGWLMTKIVSTTTADTATYAGVGNNASITLATAWANKATLVYGSIAAV